MLIDLKFKESDFTGQDVKALPDRPSESGITAAQLKAAFDRAAEELIAKGRVNEILELLASAEGAASLGARLPAGSPDGADETTAHVDGTIQGHIDAVTNPHGVTKAQVGLGQADDTSDLDKPVSRAQSVAIDAARDEMKGYADTQDVAQLQAAKDYADAQDAAGLQEAKGYADLRLVEAKSYADTQDTATLQSAKAYTDQAVIASGAADMQKAVYDPTHVEGDIFGYAREQARCLAGGFLAQTQTGTGEHYALTVPDLPNPIPDSMKMPTILFTPQEENCEGATVSLNGARTCALYCNGEPVKEGLLKAGVPVTMLYDVAQNKAHLVGTSAGGASAVRSQTLVIEQGGWAAYGTRYRQPLAIAGLGASDRVNLFTDLANEANLPALVKAVNLDGTAYAETDEPPGFDFMVQAEVYTLMQEG